MLFRSYFDSTAGGSKSIFVPNTSQVANANFYNRANTPLSNVNQPGGVSSNSYITTATPHGLTIGNQIILQGIGGAASNQPNGTFIVTSVVSNTVFRVDGNLVPSVIAAGGLSAIAGQSFMYPTTRGTVLHRAYDGGVEFSTSAESHNNQLIRQTRRYFRYQSGKGIQVSTGTLLKPSFRVDSLTSSGSLITVKTKDAHFVSPNVNIVISGAVQSGYNGQFPVSQVLDPYTFTYIANTAPTVSPATGNYRLSANTW